MVLRIAPKILVVDDHDTFRSILAKALGLSNYRVVQADSGPTCLFVARQEQPDLVLLDLMMTDQEGLAICRQLRADPTTSHIPILVVSAWSGPHVRTVTLAAGANSFLEKPFSTLDLEKHVEALLLGRMPARAPVQLSPALAS